MYMQHRLSTTINQSINQTTPSPIFLCDTALWRRKTPFSLLRRRVRCVCVSCVEEKALRIPIYCMLQQALGAAIGRGWTGVGEARGVVCRER